MAYDEINISIPVKFDIKTAPRGMIDYDPKALSREQQRELNLFKVNMRKENVLYLSEHPEVRAIIAMIVRETTIHQPRNLIDYVAKLFTRPEHEIRKEIKKILNESKIETEYIPYEDYEEWDY